jgi:hypothetical protein
MTPQPEPSVRHRRVSRFSTGAVNNTTRTAVIAELTQLWKQAIPILPKRASRQVKTALYVLGLTYSGSDVLCLLCGNVKCDLCKTWECCCQCKGDV